MRHAAPPDPRAYAEQVYAWVRQIPRGKVMTYGQIAARILPPSGIDPDEYRRVGPIWVGGAMANAPDDLAWQRVINSQGKVSERPGLGAVVQRRLLEQEGVEFDPKDRVDLKRFQWDSDAPEQPALL